MNIERGTVMRKLRKELLQNFSSEELEMLVWDLGTDISHLPGNTLELKLHEFLERLARHRYFPELLNILKEERGHIPWDELIIPLISPRGHSIIIPADTTSLQAFNDNLAQIEGADEDDSEDDAGLLDITERGEELLATAGHAMENLTDSMNLFTANLKNHTRELDEENLKPQRNRNRTKRILTSIANEMLVLVSRVETEFPIHNNAMMESVELIGHAIDIYSLDFRDNVDTQDLISLLGNIKSLLDSIVVAEESMNTLYIAVQNTPRITTNYNKARNSLLMALKKVIDGLSSERNLVEELVNKLQWTLKDLSEADERLLDIGSEVDIEEE